MKIMAASYCLQYIFSEIMKEKKVGRKAIKILTRRNFLWKTNVSETKWER